MSNNAKICLSTAEYPPMVGGVGVAAQRLARNLAGAGYQVHVMTLCYINGNAQETLERTNEDGFIAHRLFRRESNVQATFDYRSLVRELDDEINFDLFHGFFLPAVYPCVPVALRRGRRRPIIASIRGSDALTLINYPYLRAAILASLRRATWITSVNQFYLDRVAKEVDIGGRSSVIRNGIQLPSEDATIWRLDNKNRGVVGTVGQFRQVKDIPLLIRGYSAVKAELRSRLLLAGYFIDPEEESWSRTLSEEFGIAEQVEVTGQFSRDQVFNILRSMHVYVQSSAFEGLPNSLLEAASLGVPLVATAVGGMREVLEDGRSGLLVPHGDPAQLGVAIERILSDPALAKLLSQGALRLAKQLSRVNEREQWLALYDRLLSTHETR